MKYNCTFASLISLICDCFLAILKFVVGFAASSHALISDAVHSCADVFSCMIVLIGISVGNSRNKRIKQYAYTIEKMSLVVLSLILIVTGISIGISGLKSIYSDIGNSTIPEISALAVALFALTVKELLFIYNIRVARKNGNALMKATAWHHQSDALSCLGSFAGILGARLGYPALDPMASVAISLLIIKVGIQIFVGAIKQKKDSIF